MYYQQSGMLIKHEEEWGEGAWTIETCNSVSLLGKMVGHVWSATPDTPQAQHPGGSVGYWSQHGIRYVDMKGDVVTSWTPSWTNLRETQPERAELSKSDLWLWRIDDGFRQLSDLAVFRDGEWLSLNPKDWPIPH